MHNQLGRDLKLARKAKPFTQATLAAKAGLSIPAIRLLERGRGNLGSWERVLATLGLVLVGRNLPAANGIGQRVALLRKRHGFGQRAFAEMIGITQPTLVRLERRGRGRIAVVERALTALGAGARLVSETDRTAFYNHAGNSSAHHGWETPDWLLKTLCGVFGVFDLDPCSPTHNRRFAPVRARIHYTMDDNGLSLPWHGKVFVNPPYGRTLRQWTTKAREEVASANAQVVVGLVPARTDTNWWHIDVAGHSSVFFLRGRLCFGNSEQSAPFPSALVIWGGTPIELDAIRTALPNAWHP